MQTVMGYVSSIQEGRFRLVTGDGRGLLLTLAHNAPLDQRDLTRLHEERRCVVVKYTGEPNIDSGVVHSIEIASSPS